MADLGGNGSEILYPPAGEFALDSRRSRRINTIIPPAASGRPPVWTLRVATALVVLGLAPRLDAADPFEFKDGDRVVLLGSTLIEREQKYGYWELMLTLKNKDKAVTFRNLGWSGDTVFGEARNGFDESPKGFERLVSLTRELKPTVVVVCYGHNESFEGKAGVPKFTAGLEKLLDAIADTKARIVLMSPTPFENTGPVKDAEAKNKALALYRDAIKATAEKRKLEFVDLFDRLRSRGNGLRIATENGMHLAEDGYVVTAIYLLDPKPTVDAINLFSNILAIPDDSLAIRAKILEKNELFFYRWRPQNQTYLFGFRKHEQGVNAKEVAEFDPLVAKAEAEIAELRKALAK
jgi:lysophospholipase L1-like esterase